MNETKTNEKESLNTYIEPVSESDLQVIDISILTKEVQKRIEAIRQLVQFVVNITYPSDWVRFSPKQAYLTSGGAERVARQFGITWDKFQYRKEMRDGYYFYVYESIFRYRNDKLGINIEVPAMGTCSSKDKFFARRGDQYLPMEEVDEPSILKKAYSNMIRNGVCVLLGLKDMPKEAFSDQYWQSIPYVEFQKGKEGGQVETSEEEKEILKKLGDMILEMAGGNKEIAKNILKKVSTFEGKEGKQVEGVTDLKQLKGKRLQVVYEKICNEYKNWLNDIGG